MLRSGVSIAVAWEVAGGGGGVQPVGTDGGRQRTQLSLDERCFEAELRDEELKRGTYFIK